MRSAHPLRTRCGSAFRASPFRITLFFPGGLPAAEPWPLGVAEPCEPCKLLNLWKHLRPKPLNQPCVQNPCKPLAAPAARRLFDTNFTQTRCQRFDWAVNYSTMSPCGSLICIVGDDPVGVLVDARSGREARICCPSFI